MVKMYKNLKQNDLQIEKNIRLFEKLYHKDPKDDNYIDLYFFWMVFQIIRQLDAEDSSIVSSYSPLASEYDYPDENPTRNKQQWLHNGIINMIIENPLKYRGLIYMHRIIEQKRNMVEFVYLRVRREKV